MKKPANAAPGAGKSEDNDSVDERTIVNVKPSPLADAFDARTVVQFDRPKARLDLDSEESLDDTFEDLNENTFVPETNESSPGARASREEESITAKMTPQPARAPEPKTAAPPPQPRAKAQSVAKPEPVCPVVVESKEPRKHVAPAAMSDDEPPKEPAREPQKPEPVKAQRASTPTKEKAHPKPPPSPVPDADFYESETSGVSKPEAAHDKARSYHSVPIAALPDEDGPNTGVSHSGWTGVTDTRGQKPVGRDFSRFTRPQMVLPILLLLAATAWFLRARDANVASEPEHASASSHAETATAAADPAVSPAPRAQRPGADAVQAQFDRSFARAQDQARDR